MTTAHFRNIRKELISTISTAEKHLKIAVAWFTNQDLFDVLMDKLSGGVEIELVIIDDFINNGDFGLNFQEFINRGGKLYYGKEENPMHHKFCVVDKEVLITGSYNWTYYAESKNHENIVKFEQQQELVGQYSQEFDLLIKNLSIAREANKIAIEDIEQNNLFSTRYYLGLDLVYRAKETHSIEYLNKAMLLIPNNKVLIKAHNSFNALPIVEQPSTPKNFHTAIEPIVIPKPKPRFTKTSVGINSRINGVEDRFSIIVPKGTALPCKLPRTFNTVKDNQTQVTIETFKGEHQEAHKNTRLGKSTLNDLPKKPAGEASVTVTISINDNGDLIVEAISNDTGNKLEASYYDNDLID